MDSQQIFGIEMESPFPVSKKLVQLVAAMAMVASSAALSFELLSEGAMDSVSAVSADSAEDILNIAGPTAAGLTEDYEELPFETSVEVGILELDEVSEDLNFSLTQEVEQWASSLRQQEGVDFNIGTTNVVPTSSFDEQITIDAITSGQAIVIEIDEEEADAFELRRVNDFFREQSQNLDAITFRFERVIERAEVPDSRPFLDRTVGNGYVSDSRSFSNVRLTAVRD